MEMATPVYVEELTGHKLAVDHRTSRHKPVNVVRGWWKIDRMHALKYDYALCCCPKTAGFTPCAPDTHNDQMGSSVHCINLFGDLEQESCREGLYRADSLCPQTS
jgi:hypothetical protein